MNRTYSPLLFWLALTIGASLALFHTSDRVNELDRHLRALNTQIEGEQESLHILKAEWVYLSNPARIEAEAQRHLDLQPTAPRHVVTMRDLGDLLPLHDGVEPAPVQTADAFAAPAPPAPRPAHAPQGRVVAAINSGHINDHMIMQHEYAQNPVKAEASSDRIGALIGTLGLRP